MKNYLTPILFLLLFSYNSFSQSWGCNNENFEMSSATFSVPSVVPVTSTGAVTGWTVESGTNSGTVTSCNIYSCCSNNPNSMQLIGTTTTSGFVDPNIGSSYPISSFYETYSPVYSSTSTPNSGGGYGNWFCKLNDDVADKGIQRIKKCIDITLSNAIFALSVLPVIQNSSHGCCYQPSIKVWLRNSGLGSSCGVTIGSGTIIPSPQLSIFSSTACSSSLGGFISCPANPLFSYTPWQTFVFDLSSYIGQAIGIELAVTDCAMGDHAAYCYFDAQCIPYDFLGVSIACLSGYNMYSSCGPVNFPVAVPANIGPFLWNGPAGWPFNGATTNTVNLTLPGVYTVSCYPMGTTTPIVKTFTVNLTPPASATLTSSQSTACAGGNTIALTGSPSGGVYTGSFVTGNSFTPASVGNYSVSYTYTDSNGCSATDTKSINVISCTTGLSNLTTSNFNVELYPQPAKDLVNISLNNFYESSIEIKITDITGKMVRLENLIVRNNKTLIETSELSNGVYILQLINKNQIAQKRLIIAK
jgi:hypothetical protein